VSSQITIPLIAALLAAFWFIIASRARRTNPGTAKLALVGGSLAVVLTVATAIVGIAEIPITAAVAIPMFVATIVEFGLIIALAARTAGGRVSKRVFLICVLMIIGGILGGIVMMFQPWTPSLFNLGFDLVLISLVAFIIWSHIAPKNAPAR